MQVTTKKTSTSKNERKSLKRPILTAELINGMYSAPFEQKSFTRSASKFWNCRTLGKLLYLTNKKTARTCVINFQHDEFGYMAIRINEGLILNFPKPKYNKDLFIKIFNHNIL